MCCGDLNNALLPFINSYEQVCVVGDVNVQNNRPSAINHMPALWLSVNEQMKSLDTVTKIWDFLFANDITRRGVVIAIGGGVLTDLVGFAASTYKRGIDYINIPTTLLAMVDASCGGKTGINYHGLKNSIGVFAPPVETIIDPEWLKTLPPQEFLSGFAEMLKTGLLDANGLWKHLLEYDLDIMPLESLAPLIDACVAVKQQIVNADPCEENLRKALNLGHTFGHALEEIQMVNGTCPHGYAVLYGLIAELYLSVTKLGCPREPLQQLTQIMLHYYGRPKCKCSDRDRLIALMQQDKKNERADEINCTLIRSIGSPVINQIITPDEAAEALDYLFSL